MQEEAWNQVMHTSSGKPLVESVRVAGQDFLRQAHEYLQNHDVLPTDPSKMTSYCEIHKRRCPLIPPEVCEAGTEGHLWVEIGGNTCTPWSASGAQKGWLDPNGVPSICWGAFLNRGAPDIVINECTPRFPGFDFLSLWLGTTHKVVTKVICPTNLGISARCSRVYTIAWKNERVISKHEEVFEEAYKAACVRTLTTDAQIFFQAPEEAKQAFIGELLQARHFEEPSDRLAGVSDSCCAEAPPGPYTSSYTRSLEAAEPKVLQRCSDAETSPFTV